MRNIFAFLCLFSVFNTVLGQQDSLKSHLLIERNYFALSYEFSHFNTSLSNWNTSYIEGQFKNNSWTFIPRITISSRFNQNAWLAEQEVYKKFKGSDYLYLKAAYSPSFVFANYKAEVDYYKSFTNAWEAIIGAKYMQYQDSINVSLASLGIAKYYSKYYTVLRSNFGFQNSSKLNIFSASFQQRLYHNDNAYTALTVSYGLDPNNLLFNNNPNIIVTQNKSMAVALSSIKELKQKWFLQGLIEYQYLDFGISKRNQMSYALKLFYSW